MNKYVVITTVVLALSLAVLLLASCCGTRKASSKIPGHYTYQHGWSYDLKEGHIDVHETGTMDFNKDGTALDSARQVYVMTPADGGKVTWVFNYISPSRWRVEGDDFYFAGSYEGFRMELVETTLEDCDQGWADRQAHRIMKNVGSNIARETKFHIANLTAHEFVWSYTYNDGHTDTWEFYR